MHNIRLCENDESLGPRATCRTLDFTITFEHWILSILPNILFILVASARIWYLSQQPVKLERPSYIHCTAKALSVTTLIVLSAIEVFIAIQHPGALGLPRAVRFAYSLPLSTSTLLAPLVGLEHFRSLTPSTLVLSYAIFKLLADVLIRRTYIAVGLPSTADGRILVFLISANVLAYYLLAVVEVIEKRRLFNPTYASYPKECSTSIITRPLYLWLIPLLHRGSKVKLRLDDVQDIPPNFKAVSSRTSLEKAISKNKSLARALLLSNGGIFFSPILPRLVLVLATFTQPFLVQSILRFVQAENPSSEEGWALVGSYLLVYGTMVISTSMYWEKAFDIVTQYRGALVGALLDKSLKLASHESRKIGSSTASTYMSVDVDRIGSGLGIFNEIWSSFVGIGLGLSILYTKVQWAAFLPLLVIAISMGITSYCGQVMRKRQTIWLEATDKRMKLLGSVISNLLPIKMAAYEVPFTKKVTQVRNEEMRGVSRFFSMSAINVALSNSASPFCAVSVLGAYALMVQRDPSIGSFDATTIFTILTTVQLVGYPLAMIGQALPSLFTAYASLKRIENFLNLDEKPEVATAAENEINLLDPSYEFKLSQANFSWDREGPIVLNDVDFTLETGKLHMYVGPVGSGKTSMIASMLGETTLRSGSIVASTGRLKVAYAAQDAFIFSGTLRENIILGEAFDSDRYQTVIAACGLRPDLARLPSGDGTRLEDKGANLSGGQKQRVALARAVYSNAPILFLDDPLSALDAATEEHVSQALFSTSDILNGRTVFLTTHGLHHLPAADTVVVMNKGAIAFQGTYDELRKDPESLHLVQESSPSSQNPSEKSETGVVKENDQQESEVTDLEDETMQSYNNKGLHPYIFWARMAGLHRVVFSLVISATWSLLSLGMNLYIKEWSESSGHTTLWISGYLAFSIIYLIVGVIAFWYWNKTPNILASTNIHEAQVEAVLHAPFSYLQSVSAGRITNRFSQDMSTIVVQFPMCCIGAFLSAVSLTINLSLILAATPLLVFALPILSVIYWSLIKFYLATSTQLQQLESASKTPLYSSFDTIMTGLETIRSFGAQPYFGRRSDKHLDASQGPFYFRFAGMRILRTALSFMTMLIAVGMAALAVGLRKSTSAGLLGIALAGLTKISNLLAQLLMGWTEVENGGVAVERIYEVVSLKREPETQSENKLPIEELWPQHGEIAFEKYSMRYAQNLPPVLQDLSFKIPPGSRIGICGRTGSGKSSTVNALFRTVASELVTGKLTIDGIEVQELPLKTLRSSLSIVPQDPFLWHSTIRENLDIEELNSDAQIWQALEQVGMKEAVAALEAQLDTVLEDAVAFSRGQRQLICMARVLLRKRKIVVLDEATSSMDLQTDQKVRDIIAEELKGCTVLAVAHRI
ncbi:P-loop containing nucleoside triphosphate hydrolase protein, partial [Ceratobasidium sp. AG-I]